MPPSSARPRTRRATAKASEDAPPLHPAAAVFPMMTDDELDELAADIATNGQRVPIVFLPDGTLLDGRNRLAACERAGVKPESTVYDGDDPTGYVVSVNVNRRHMTTGQRAMAVALALDADGKRSNGRFERGSVPTYENVSSRWSVHIAEAGRVLDHAPDLAPLVVSGAMPLSKALDEARDRAHAAQSEGSRLSQLTVGAPDLASQVREETLTLAEAEGAARARQEKAERDTKAIEDGRMEAASMLRRAIGVLGNPQTMDWAGEYLARIDPPIDDDERAQALTAFRLLLEAT